MSGIVLVHGAWSAAWAWRDFREQLTRDGTTVFAPTLTGVGERRHLLTRKIELEDHIQDICEVLFMEDLHDVVLVGHSYGGMVITGAADRMPARVRHLVYVDAFLPDDGECVFDLMPSAQIAMIRDDVDRHGAGWLIPAPPLPADTPPEAVQFAQQRRGPQPMQTFTSPIKLTGRCRSLPTTYVYCTRTNVHDTFSLSAQRARERATCQFLALDASHNPHLTQSRALLKILQTCQSGHATGVES
ncbi:MAG TPA: alpha/beta hydrolase [Burkholderiaceae bacterium]|nr:alpha/beta hydrolase [Burkholderiaceae bacterium]